MNKDFQNPDDKPEGKTQPSSMSGRDRTEEDLWDLDDESLPSKERKDGGQSAIPSRRKDESSIKSRVPVERHTDSPVPSNKAVAEPTITEGGDEEPTEKAVPPPAGEELSPSEAGETEDEESKTAEKASPKDRAETGSFLASLTKIEKIGITALAAILVITATFALIHFNSRIPVKPLISEKLDLPVKGKRMTVTSVETYWREPVTEGENPDIIQRGVKLIPVIKIGLEDSSGAIRILFRDDRETVIGDNISRSIESGGTIEIAGTAGFEDAGMHAAYRTGDSGRWTVQVLEGPSVAAPLEQFDTLLETEISPNIR